jgi:hypothetical protein
MAKRRGGRFKKMLGLGFISFEKAFSSGFRRRRWKYVHMIRPYVLCRTSESPLIWRPLKSLSCGHSSSSRNCQQ